MDTSLLPIESLTKIDEKNLVPPDPEDQWLKTKPLPLVRGKKEAEGSSEPYDMHKLA